MKNNYFHELYGCPISLGVPILRYNNQGLSGMIISPHVILTFNTPWAISADDRLALFYLFFFPENRPWCFMQNVYGDN